MHGQLVSFNSGEDSKELWFAAYTKHQHEKIASEYLGKKGFEVVLPLYSAVHRWKDRSKVVSLPVFPCYLFVKMNLERKIEVLTTPGVFWMVENGGRACAIPDSDIDGIRRSSMNPTQVTPHAYLKTGDWVRVRSGPLTGLEGILARVKNSCRVVLSIALLQKSVAVEVDQSVLQRMAPPVGTHAEAVRLSAKQIA